MAKPQITQAFPSLVLVLMGLMDCATTAVGVIYAGAVEANPVLTGLVNTNIAGFMLLKIGATLFTAASLILAKRALNQSENKESKNYKIFQALFKISYVGLLSFMIIVVVNNLLVLFA
ncbi:MAG: DUF5658 family protein [Candidatus Bathyarchaeota archaeon]|nr:DUF5658 family protein [Candidatus Bathyarchaeota archaeon]